MPSGNCCKILILHQDVICRRRINLPFDRPFDKPFDKLTVLSNVEGLMALSRSALSSRPKGKAEGRRCL